MFAVTKPVAAALARTCDAWHLQLDKLSFERGGEATAKTQTLKHVVSTYDRRSSAQLHSVCAARARFLEALKHQHGQRLYCVTLVLESRLLLHLGRASALENVGLYCDRTTGLPVIPGTALKGVLSTWACWEANQNKDGSFNDGPAFRRLRGEFPLHFAHRIFGDDCSEGSEQAGDVVFVGGFPATPPGLGLDIVNPHYDVHGRDKDHLTPNTFLCVEPGTEWRFAFFVRPGAPDAAKLLEATSAWLVQALTQLGIGAKIAAGYGRFRQPNKTDLAARVKRAREATAAESAVADKAKLSAAKAELEAAAKAILAADYNEASFKNLMHLADSKGQWNQFPAEMDKLRKPQNANWLQRFKDSTKGKGSKDLRKQPWYPL